MKIGLILFMLLCLAAAASAPYAAMAAEPGVNSGVDSGATSYTTPIADTDTTLDGNVSYKQQFFQVPVYWKVGQVKIALDYKASPLAQDKLSSVTVSVNGTAITSFRPVASESARQRMVFEVPVSALIQGTNTLTIEGHIVSGDEQVQICTPTYDADKWFQIYKSSSIIVGYSPLPLANAIADFAARFTGLDTFARQDNAIAVPKDADASELEAAVYALSGLAKSGGAGTKGIPLLAYGIDDSDIADKKLVVAVAMRDRLPASLRSLIPDAALGDKAVIRLVDAKGQPTLVVTSDNAALLVKAGRLVANAALLDQLSGPVKEVTENTEVASPVPNITKIVSLTDAGDQVTGINHRTKDYYVALPANRSIAEASKLNLRFRYAKNLDFDRSLVTVLVNGKPIGSKKLTEALADGDSLNLTIPKNMNLSGNFTITAAFDLELKNNVSCVLPQDQMPWAFIDADTALQLNTKDRTELLFNNYPYPFLRDGIYNQVGVVLPGTRDADTYRTIGNLFNLLGQYAEGNAGEVRFFGTDVTSDQLKDRNVIAIGSYADNPVIRDANKSLYFKYNAAGTGFVSNEKMSIDEEYGKRIGSLQLIVSPLRIRPRTAGGHRRRIPVCVPGFQAYR
ncbi:cellulose biosynthesis cyclic di-GMP-binding regulatory protein BcsB [Cohnella ginsengisoli]|uniref:Cellulose biosynthesis cyclic di-GMP-binding regulatory protein BcsB n=1 Tax=Cohnella ginsengisoli TaxID=425004 RepID=A0A9X4KLZ7_9BACL|nr:cellulose biosynthesis cyclic di-GMP-binding regulatory protein BcsB [Cohnella ginsengisoli]MDG0794381.1 cellulose biosynthesis cyclic di-GMP-binding regulatory protein BcsB [Cohnella ginsengisoli]